MQTGNSTTGSITITDGVNGNITISPNGTGEIIVNNDMVVDGDLSLGTGNAIISADDITFNNSENISNATDNTIAITAATTSLSGDLTVTGNDIAFGNTETISNNTNNTIAITAATTSVSGDLTVIGNDITFGNTETISNAINNTIAITSANVEIVGDLVVGTGSAAGSVKSKGDNDLTLQTGNSTTGSITITDGANGDITISPNGTGSISMNDSPIKRYSATLIAESGTTRTLSAADNGTIIKCTNGSATTITVPTGLATGFNCMVVQYGAGQVTMSPTSGSITLNQRNGLKTAGQYAILTIVCIDGGSNIFIVSGDTAS